MSKLALYIGIEFNRLTTGMLLTQRSYSHNLLERCNKLSCAVMTTPMEEGEKLHSNMDADYVDITNYQSLVGGSLIHLTSTKPNISYAINCLSRFMSAPQHATGTP